MSYFDALKPFPSTQINLMLIKTEGHVNCQLKVSGHEFKVRTIRIVMCFLPELPIEVRTMCEWCVENSWFLPNEHHNLK